MRKYLPLFIILYSVIACGHPEDQGAEVKNGPDTTQDQTSERPEQPIFRGKSSAGGYCKVQVLNVEEQIDPNAPETGDPALTATKVTMQLRVREMVANSNRVFSARSASDEKSGAYIANLLQMRWKLDVDRQENLDVVLGLSGDPVEVTYHRDPSWTALGVQFGEAHVTCSDLKLAERQEYYERGPIFTGPVFLPY